jgi:hypothetical protein
LSFMDWLVFNANFSSISVISWHVAFCCHLPKWNISSWSFVFFTNFIIAN